MQQRGRLATLLTLGTLSILADIAHAEPAGDEPATSVMYLNFEGVSLTEGVDDATRNIGMLGGDFEPYGGDGTMRAAVTQAVMHDWADFDVTFTTSRPASGDYTMAVISPTMLPGSSSLGKSVHDCRDLMPRNVVYARHGAGDGITAAAQGTTISHELAHAYGVEHVTDPDDIMFAEHAGAAATFRDRCAPVVEPSHLCVEQHALFCADGSQNAHQELLDRFGRAGASPDTPSTSETDTDTGGGGIGSDDAGCGCAGARRSRAPWALVLASVILIRRRRRSTARA